jgi:hypothetical protein
MLSASQYEAGCIRPLDGYVHAVHKKLTGIVAVCRAGPIFTQLVGGFDPTADDACPSCLARLRSDQPLEE